MKRLFYFVTLLTMVVLAAPETNPIPDPELIPEADSFSIAVVEFRPDDEAIKSLLEAALKSVSSGEAKLPASMADVSDYLARNNRADMLFAGLPFQAVRVDRMLPSNQSSPTYAITLAGWKGLQSQLFNSLSVGPDGKTFPSVRYRTTDLVSRDHSDDPSWPGTLCRVQGTFLFSPSADQAKKTFDRMIPKDKPVGPAGGALLAAYKALPKTPDAFGVMLNQKGAFSALLKSVNNEHVQKLRDKVGSDRLDKAVANTQSAVWQVEIVSSERAEMQAVLTVDPKNQAEVAAVIEDGKGNLDATKVTEVTITQAPGTVTVKAAVIGLKQMMLDAMAKGG
ncbi:hypothetical protein IV102_13605 [bacterium]|nr:hypothetical protein [bacterium]